MGGVAMNMNHWSTGLWRIIKYPVLVLVVILGITYHADLQEEVLMLHDLVVSGIIVLAGAALYYGGKYTTWGVTRIPCRITDVIPVVTLVIVTVVEPLVWLALL